MESKRLIKNLTMTLLVLSFPFILSKSYFFLLSIILFRHNLRYKFSRVGKL